jgi:hypothetical protein
MAFTYEDKPADCIRDAIRFLVGDTEKIPDRSLTDNEIRFISARFGFTDITVDFDETSSSVARKLLAVAAECCEALAGRFSADANYGVGGVSEQVNQRANEYARRGRELRKQLKRSVAPLVFGRSISDKVTAAEQTDTVKSVFRKEMFDNEETETY